MMIETVQQGYVQKAMPNFEAQMKLTKDREKELIRELEIMKNREIQSRQDKRDAERIKRIVRDQLRRRWARHMKVDNSCRALPLFGLRY